MTVHGMCIPTKVAVHWAIVAVCAAVAPAYFLMAASMTRPAVVPAGSSTQERRWLGDWHAPAASIDRDKVVAFWLIGASSPRDVNRRVGHNIKQRGWKWFVSEKVVPQVQWGVRRVQIHNPFGHLGEEGMRLDQYLLAQEQGVTWLTDGFVEAWRPLTAGELTGEPVEVICYLGSPVIHDPFKRLYESGDIEAWQRLFDASIAPALEAGMSIAFDTATGADADHPFYARACDLREQGVRVYLEGLPSRGRPHWAPFKFIIMERYLRKLDALSWVAPRSAVSGEVLWLVDRIPPGRPGRGEAWVTHHYADILSRGYTLNAPMAWLPSGVAIDALLSAGQAATDPAYGARTQPATPAGSGP